MQEKEFKERIHALDDLKEERGLIDQKSVHEIFWSLIWFGFGKERG